MSEKNQTNRFSLCLYVVTKFDSNEKKANTQRKYKVKAQKQKKNHIIYTRKEIEF